jgi:hypothetical protein
MRYESAWMGVISLRFWYIHCSSISILLLPFKLPWLFYYHHYTCSYYSSVVSRVLVLVQASINKQASGSDVHAFEV